jgi:hypothetical protein
MSLKACPLCGYRYNAPENQTCGKCKGWLGGGGAGGAVAVAAPVAHRSLVPRSAAEAACYLPLLAGAFLGWPNPIGAAFGLLMGALMIKVVRLDMVAAGVFFGYLIFLLIFNSLYLFLEPVLQPLVGRTFKH